MGARFGLNIMSAVSAQGELRFMTVHGRIAAAQCIEFITRLNHGIYRMIFLIMDGHPIHKTKCVTIFIETESMKKRVRLFFLPPFSPELNPDKRVWKDLKNHSMGRQIITAPDQMHRAVISHSRHIQQSLERVRGYFHNKATQYTA